MKFIYTESRDALVNVDHIRRIYIREFPEAVGSRTHAVVAELSCGASTTSVILLGGTGTKCKRALDTFYLAMNTDAPYPELDDAWIDYRKNK